MTVETQIAWVGRLILAALLGVVLGWEREARGRDAGVRTFGAVSLGACLFSIISFAVAPEGREPTRIAAQIVTGVGFLGVGPIALAFGLAESLAARMHDLSDGFAIVGPRSQPRNQVSSTPCTTPPNTRLAALCRGRRPSTWLR